MAQRILPPSQDALMLATDAANPALERESVDVAQFWAATEHLLSLLEYSTQASQAVIAQLAGDTLAPSRLH